METILIVEDDPNTQELMSIYLRNNGFQTVLANNGKEAMTIIGQQAIALALVDIMMPEMDGYQLTDALRQANYQLPILMVTAKETPSEKKKGFLVGTDDYMTKPVDEEEMLLRIRALLRRSQIVAENRIMLGDVLIDADSLQVTKEQTIINLPQKEFLLLFKLLSYPGKIFTRLQLMDDIWGYDSETDARTVNVHINRLREKFAEFPEFSILTVRGLGYKAERHV
ncbi:response regulator transcription factor [Vagococcus sp. BWB3-3]|uniref:Heme response regulator HssR n=1 Tax=Vagococcus allomyrinae TaxID=2794353 RepID=A0A940PDZ0_9ENTE|nr:response regulator transcription factor [Vagococcus allomyrinae]MBP1043075.1 response regulator transcription factor [Vagococcus allomyrinae]